MEETDKARSSNGSPERKALFWDGVALAALLALLLYLLHEPLFNDRVLLPFDTRLWPPFSGQAAPEVLTARASMIYSDLPGWMMPSRLVMSKMMDEGLSPWWSPLTLGGLPMVASLSYPVYYPLNFLLHRVLGADPLGSLGFQTFLNLFLAGLGMYLFLRSLHLGPLACLLGSLCVSLSAWYITHAYIPIFLNAAAWIPFMFWAAEGLTRKRAFGWHAVGLALFTGFSFLGGFPQTTVTGIYGAGIWLLCRALFRRGGDVLGGKVKPLAAFVLASGLGLCLSLGEILPAAELKANSLRDSDYPLEYYKETALQVPALMEQAVPGFFGHPANPEGGGGREGSVRDFLTFRLYLDYHGQNNIMENALFIGTLPFLLALAALGWIRRAPVWIFATLSAFALLIALGTPLLDFAYCCLPGLKVGSPKRLLVLHTIALAGLAAFGLDRCFLRPEWKPGRFWTTLILAAGMFTLLLLTWKFPWFSEEIGGAWKARAVRLGVAAPSPEEVQGVLAYLRGLCWPAAAALVLLGLARAVRMAFPEWAYPALFLVLFAVLELCLFGRDYIVSQPAEGQYPTTDTTEFLAAQEEALGPFRTAAFRRNEILMANLCAVHGISSMGGVSGLVHRRYGTYCHRLDPGLIDMADPRFVGALQAAERLASPMLDLLGVKYMAVGNLEDVPVLEGQGFKQVYRNDREGLALHENPGALPRAFAVTACRVARGGDGSGESMGEEALDMVSAPGFDPADRVVLEGTLPRGFAPRSDPEGRAPEVSIVDYQPLEATIRVNMHQALGFLVVTDIWYPGWTAQVDDEPAPVLLADYAFRAVALGEGAHTVRFRYEPGSVRWGFAASGLALGLILLWGGCLWRSARRAEKA